MWPDLPRRGRAEEHLPSRPRVKVFKAIAPVGLLLVAAGLWRHLPEPRLLFLTLFVGGTMAVLLAPALFSAFLDRLYGPGGEQIRLEAGISKLANRGLEDQARRHTRSVMPPTSNVRLIIAVDGPAASGKGTVAGRLARHYGLPFLDTGLLYRAVGMAVLAAGGDLGDEAAATAAARTIDASRLSEDPALTTGEAGEAASRVAGYPGVRAALLELQQDFARQPGGAVLDGRDIGTVIAPDAPVKLFVTATPETRARRRWLQLTARGDDISFEEMLADIQRRDERDAGRGAAPMVQAPDAVLLDTTDMDIEAAFDAARRIVEAARVRQGL